MSWFNIFNRGVSPAQVRDISGIKALPPGRSPMPRGGPVVPQGGAIVPKAGGVPGLGLLSAIYSIPGFAETKQRNAEENIRLASTAPGMRAISNELQYIGNQFSQGRLPYASPRVSNLPPNYRGDELRLSAAARAAAGPSAGGGIGGGNMASYVPAGGERAAERAYQQEKSRVAQLTAQDPELLRYEAARKVAAAPGATPEQVQSAEDIGMQIWAQKYGKTLAPKVKPGQAGYDVIQRTLNAGTMGAPMSMSFPTGTGLLGSSGAPETSSYVGVKPASIGNVPPLSPYGFANAQNQQQAAMFTRFTEGPTLSSQPLGSPTASMGEVPTYSGASGVQPMGDSISGESAVFGTDAAKALADSYVKKLLNFRGI